VTIGERAAATLAAPSTSNAFFVGFTEKGPVDEPIYAVSMADVVEKAGERLATEPLLYDSLDAFFKEGGSNAYIARVSPGAVTASKTLVDSESKKVRLISAKSPGSWGNSIKVSVTLAGGKVTYTVKYEGVLVEASPALDTLEEEIAWSEEESAYIVIAKESEGSGDPKTQEVTLAGGTYATGSATTEHIETAIDLFGRDLGPGQIAFPGNVSEAVQEYLLAHGEANNRRAVLDGDEDASVAELVSQATALRGETAKYGTLMGNWAVIPGLSRGTYRRIPLSGVFLGVIARCESEGNNPNVAAAGKRGRCKFALDLVTKFTDVERGELDDAGIIPALMKRGTVTIFGDVTLVNKTTEPNWRSFASSRLAMGVAALADLILDDFDFEQIDGHGYVFGDLKGKIEGGACMPYYLANAFYGQTPPEAFEVNTGPDVNTPSSIANEEIKAQIAFRASPHGHTLSIEVVKVPITESL